MKTKLIFLTLFTIVLSIFWVGCQEQATQPDNSITNNNNRLYALAGAPAEYVLYAGQNIVVGQVEVWNDETNLYVKFVIDPDWCLEETHVAVAASLEGIPQTKKDNPIPGQFAYKHEEPDCETEDLYTIPLSVECGAALVIAAHAVVVKGTAITLVSSTKTQTAGWFERASYDGTVDAKYALDAY